MSDVHKEKTKVYKCALCIKTFLYPSTLKSHIETAHNTAERYICDSCDKPYASKVNLRLHIKAVHEKVKKP